MLVEIIKEAVPVPSSTPQDLTSITKLRPDPSRQRYTPPQTVQSPSAFAKCLAFTEGNALVSVSAVMSSVEQ